MDTELQQQLTKKLPNLVAYELGIEFDYTDLQSVQTKLGTVIAIAKKYGLDKAANWLEWRK